MRLLKILGLSIAAIVAILVIVGLFLPSSYRVSRSVKIQAPLEVVYDHVNDLKKNELWSPWSAADPTMKTTYSNKTVGVGGSYNWTSENSGAGSMVITRSELSRIEADLDFGDEGKAQGFWDFKEGADSIDVTWGFAGDAGMNLVGRYFGVMMDGMVGPYFESGLASLKKITEAAPAPQPEPAVEPLPELEASPDAEKG